MTVRAATLILVIALGLLVAPLATSAQQAGQPSVQKPVQSLRNRDPLVRLGAARALAQLGPAAKDAIPALVEALRDPLQALGQTEGDPADVWAHLAVAQALASIGPDAVPALTQALRHTEHTVRLGATIALGQMRPAGNEVVLALAQALQDPEAAVQQNAIAALVQLGSGAVPALVQQLLRAAGDDERQRAADSLVRLGPAAKDAVPALVEALRDPDDDVRRYAAQALGDIGPAASQAVPALREILKDHPSTGQLTRKELARNAAEEALRKIEKP